MDRQELKRVIERAGESSAVPEDLRQAAKDGNRQFDYCPACLKLTANNVYLCSCGGPVKTIFSIGAAW
jgi:hypothetical protein